MWLAICLGTLVNLGVHPASVTLWAGLLNTMPAFKMLAWQTNFFSLMYGNSYSIDRELSFCSVQVTFGGTCFMVLLGFLCSFQLGCGLCIELWWIYWDLPIEFMINFSFILLGKFILICINLMYVYNVHWKMLPFPHFPSPCLNV